MNMNLPHLHLILNHVPTVGLVIALALLATGLLRKSDAVAQIALELLYGVALLTLPAYITGVATHARPRRSPRGVGGRDDAPPRRRADGLDADAPDRRPGVAGAVAGTPRRAQGVHDAMPS